MCSHTVPSELTDLYFWVKIYFNALHIAQGSRRVKSTTQECRKRWGDDSTVEREWEKSVCWEVMNGEVRLLPDFLAYKNLKSSKVNSWGFAIYAHWSHLTLTFAKLFSHLWNKETELNYLEGLLKLWHLWEQKHWYGKWLKIVRIHLSSALHQNRKKSWLSPKTAAHARIADTPHTALIDELKPCWQGSISTVWLAWDCLSPAAGLLSLSYEVFYNMSSHHLHNHALANQHFIWLSVVRVAITRGFPRNLTSVTLVLSYWKQSLIEQNPSLLSGFHIHC